MGNYNNSSRIRRDQWRSQPVSRSVNHASWMDTPMARPTGSSTWSNTSMAESINRTGYRPRSPGRFRLDLPVLMGIAFFILLCASLTIVTKMVAAAFKGDETPVVQQEPALVEMDKPVQKVKQTKILLIGTDQRPQDGGFRTDVLILVALDPNTNTVSAVSFPRDLWVQVPSKHDQLKINQVFQQYGWKIMVEMFKVNFGVKPDYYVLTNFNGFVDLINSRGGIDVEVAKPHEDACDVYQAVDGKCSVQPGTVQMDGGMALWYVRSRQTTDDIDRLRRQQEVIYALAKKMINITSLTRLGEIKDQFGENIQTNLSLEKAVKFLPLAMSVMNNPDSIQRRAITKDEAPEGQSWLFQYILLPDEEAVKALIQDAGIELDE